MRRQSKQRTDEPRSLGSGSKVNHEAQKQAIIDVALAYVICSILHDIPAYIGTVTTTGGLRVKFYPDDDPAQVYISTTDDFEVLMPDQLSDLTQKEITWTQLCKMAPWLAGAAQELRKPRKRQEPPVDLPKT